MGRPPGDDSVVLRDGLHIFLRGKTWWVYLKLEGQKKPLRKSLKTSDLAEAKKKAETEFEEATLRARQGRPAGKTSFSKLVVDYLASKPNGSPKTFHEEIIRRHLEPFFKSFDDFGEFTDSDYLDYIHWRRQKLTGKGEPPKNQSLNRENIVLRGIVGYAIKRGILTKTNAPEIYALPTEATRRPEFSEEELSELLSVAEKRVSEVKHAVHKQERQLLYDWIVVMVHSGLRPEESRNLTWGEVSLDGDTPKLHIAASKSKRRKQRDTFTMPAAIERLKEMKERQENHLEAIGKKLKPSDYIFSAMKKDGLAQVKSFKGGFRRLVDACSFSRSKADGELSGESLRHTYATMRLEEGTDQHRLADNMGTSSLMIHRHYGHIQLGHFYQELTKTRSDPQTSSPDVAALSEKFDEVLANSKKDKSESITEIYRKQVKKEWLEQNYGKEPSEEPGGEEIFEGWVFIRMKEEGHGDLYEMPDDLPDSLPD